MQIVLFCLEVEYIKDMNNDEGPTEYLVKWENYEAETWELAKGSLLNNAAVQTYNEENVAIAMALRKSEITHAGSFQIDKVVGRQINTASGKVDYLVKWKRLPTEFNSWEPHENLTGNSYVRAYNAEERKKATEKAIKKAE